MIDRDRTYEFVGKKIFDPPSKRIFVDPKNIEKHFFRTYFGSSPTELLDSFTDKEYFTNYLNGLFVDPNRAKSYVDVTIDRLKNYNPSYSRL